MYPNPAEVLLLVPLLMLVQAARVLAWRVADYDLRLVLLELLAGLEMMGVGSVFSAGKALTMGNAGIALYVVAWFFIRLYRRKYWLWNEKANPASLLASVKAEEMWMELALVLMWAQFTGAWIAYRYIMWFSRYRTESLDCNLPVKLSLLTSGAVEGLGTFLIELSSRGLKSTHGCSQSLHFWVGFSAKLIIYASAKLYGAGNTGGIFNPVTASVRYHMCYLDKYFVSRLLFVYIFCPCIGALLAVILASRVRRMVHCLHAMFSCENIATLREGNNVAESG